jgi:hypothetical protein
MMTIHLFQTVPSGCLADTGFTPLLTDTHATWANFKAIRTYFLENQFDENALYGFMSSSFMTETGIQAQHISRFVEDNPNADVYVFYPFVEDALFLNVFEQGDYVCSGLKEVAQQYLDAIGLSHDIGSWVTEADVAVRSPYIVAKPVFWQTWFDLAEQVHTLAQSTDAPIAHQLNVQVSATAAPMKALLIERLASLVLDLDQSLSLMACDGLSMKMAESLSLTEKKGLQTVNKLKHIYRQQQDAAVLAKFYDLRNVLLTQSVSTVKLPESAVTELIEKSLVATVA